MSAISDGAVSTVMAHLRRPFGVRMQHAMREFGPLCVGLDPHPGLLAEAGLPDSAAGIERFCETILEAVGGQVAAIKPQSAFFERHGSAGIAVLERVLTSSASAGTISILDVKRGDIGSTMSAYAQAYLLDSAPLAADAVTLSPYLGYEALRPGIEMAQAHGRGVFVLALTSNPEGASVQRQGHPSVAARMIDHVSAENARSFDARDLDVSRDDAESAPGNVGLVIGATCADALSELDLLGPLRSSEAIVLAPGVGAQGATPADVAAAFSGHTSYVLAPVSRGVLAQGLSVPAIRSASKSLGMALSAALR